MAASTPSTERRWNITVLISGNGSNLQALIDSSSSSSSSSSLSASRLSHARITHVISNKKAAYGLTRAQNADIPTSYLSILAPVNYKKRHPDSAEGVQFARQEYDEELARTILQHEPRPDLVVCAGWMHILSPVFIARLKDEGVGIINLHPALPGEFDGANAIGRAWLAFEQGEIKRTGVMIHWVISEVDRGEPIITQEIPIDGCAKEEELEERIHSVEWKLIVEGTARALQQIEEKGGEQRRGI